MFGMDSWYQHSGHLAQVQLTDYNMAATCIGIGLTGGVSQFRTGYLPILLDLITTIAINTKIKN
jgi:hypothetical protein